MDEGDAEDSASAVRERWAGAVLPTQRWGSHHRHMDASAEKVFLSRVLDRLQLSCVCVCVCVKVRNGPRRPIWGKLCGLFHGTMTSLTKRAPKHARACMNAENRTVADSRSLRRKPWFNWTGRWICTLNRSCTLTSVVVTGGWKLRSAGKMSRSLECRSSYGAVMAETGSKVVVRTYKDRPPPSPSLLPPITATNLTKMRTLPAPCPGAHAKQPWR